MPKPLYVNDTLVTPDHVRAIADDIKSLRDNALKEGAFDWALLLSMNFAILNYCAELMEVPDEQGAA